MDSTPGEHDDRQTQDAIGRTELRLMNSRGRELLLKYWDFPLFASSLGRHGISLDNCRILDAGCGSGYTLELITERFHPGQLAAFDLVPSQVELARARNADATVFVADITSLELPAQSFDAVFVCGVLHHCREWRSGLTSVTRVLKNGGVLLVEEPGTAHLRFERVLTGRSPSLDAGFSLKALRIEMNRAGLAILEQRPLYFGLFASFLCIKGVEDMVPHHILAWERLRARDTRSLPVGQEVPA